MHQMKLLFKAIFDVAVLESVQKIGFEFIKF
jgi:hypothetical protein